MWIHKLILMKKNDGNQYKKWGLKRNKKGVEIDSLLNFKLNFSWNAWTSSIRELHGWFWDSFCLIFILNEVWKVAGNLGVFRE